MKKSELSKIAKTKSITHCYITKGPYYRPNSRGYTDFRSMAGVYTKEEAIKHAELCREVYIIPIKNDEHNKMILEEIKGLISRLIY